MALYGRAVPGLRLLLRLAPLFVGALVAAVWRLVAAEPLPELEPLARPQEDRVEREPAPEPVDIVTIVDDLLTAGR
jgi:hypothetical protein